MRYASVLDHRQDILRWVESPGGSRGFYSRIADYIGFPDPPNFKALQEHPKFDRAAQLFATVYGEALLRATPFWVAPHICDLLYTSADSLPEWTFSADLLPMKSGFMWYDKPLELLDGAKLSGLSWMHVTGYKRDVDMPQLAPEDSDDDPKDGKNLILVVFFVAHNTSQGHVEPSGLTVVTEGVTLDKILDPLSSETRSVQHEDSYGQKIRLLGTTLLFMNQRIVVDRETVADRATRRRYERDNKGKTPPSIRVVMLRREDRDRHASDYGSKEVEWHCQWLVRGHWRQQPYGPGKRMVRPQWIAPHWKGPENMPVKGDTVIGALVR